jgi:hypothetical protein
MRQLVDYTLKIILLFFIFARLASGQAIEPAAGERSNEATSDSQV